MVIYIYIYYFIHTSLEVLSAHYFHRVFFTTLTLLDLKIYDMSIKINK